MSSAKHGWDEVMNFNIQILDRCCMLCTLPLHTIYHIWNPPFCGSNVSATDFCLLRVPYYHWSHKPTILSWRSLVCTPSAWQTGYGHISTNGTYRQAHNLPFGASVTVCNCDTRYILLIVVFFKSFQYVTWTRPNWSMPDDGIRYRRCQCKYHSHHPRRRGL